MSSVQNQNTLGNPQKQALLETILTGAADTLGDITPVVLERYYQCYPDARQSFIEHGCGYTARLENGMVDSALYCLMTWFDRPLEIEVTLAETVPHHRVLNIPVAYFAGLQEAVVDVIADTVAPSDETSLDLLGELRTVLLARIHRYANPGGGQGNDAGEYL